MALLNERVTTAEEGVRKAESEAAQLRARLNANEQALKAAQKECVKLKVWRLDEKKYEIMYCFQYLTMMPGTSHINKTSSLLPSLLLLPRHVVCMKMHECMPFTVGCSSAMCFDTPASTSQKVRCAVMLAAHPGDS
jgi:hypothetical protein